MPEPNSGCLLWLGGVTPRGYGKIGKEPAHRASLEHATGKRGPRGKTFHTLHKCDNPSCVEPTHLRFGTMSDNIKDAARKGRLSRGERHYCAKLTAEQVREICANAMGRNEAARHYGVSDRMITKIRKGHSWSWLKDKPTKAHEPAVVKEAMEGYRAAIEMAGRAVRAGMSVREVVREFGFSHSAICRAARLQ